jgi:hypothetical protein
MAVIYRNWRMREESVAEGLVEKKRYRVSFEVEAEARELSEEVVREVAGSYENVAEILSSPEHGGLVERQRHLYDAMRRHPEALREWLWNQALVLFEGGDAYRKLVDSVGEPTEDWATIWGLLRELSDDDRRFFVGAEEDGLLPENTEELSACFDARIVSVSVEELA